MDGELTSVRSPKVVAARRLTKRAFRARERRFLAEGRQAVREALRFHALRPGGVVHEVFVTAEAASRNRDVLEPTRDLGVDVRAVSGEVMAALTQTVTPQGIVAVCAFLHQPLPEVLAHGQRLVVVLAHARDPGNVGTVIRTADAAGAEAVLMSGESVDVYNGKCVRSSAGSLFHVPLALDVPVTTAVAALRERGLRVVAADGGGDLDLYRALDLGLLDSPTAWVFGNEAWGMPDEVRALADDVVRVPIHGSAESLNLASAAAVCLYASARAQRCGRDSAAPDAPAG